MLGLAFWKPRMVEHEFGRSALIAEFKMCDGVQAEGPTQCPPSLDNPFFGNELDLTPDDMPAKQSESTPHQRT